jgi:hypothetical protein
VLCAEHRQALHPTTRAAQAYRDDVEHRAIVERPQEQVDVAGLVHQRQPRERGAAGARPHARERRVPRVAGFLGERAQSIIPTSGQCVQSMPGSAPHGE